MPETQDLAPGAGDEGGGGLLSANGNGNPPHPWALSRLKGCMDALDVFHGVEAHVG